MRSQMTFALAAVLVTGVSYGQQIDIPDWERAVLFDLIASQEPVRPGDTFELALVADIVPGYHLYGPEEPEPTRTKISLVGKALQAGEPVYPEVIRRDLAGLGEYDLYEGSIAIRVPVTLPKTYAAGAPVKASVELAYQICTDFACSAPVTDVFSLELPTAKAGSGVKKIHPQIFTRK